MGSNPFRFPSNLRLQLFLTEFHSFAEELLMRPINPAAISLSRRAGHGKR